MCTRRAAGRGSLFPTMAVPDAGPYRAVLAITDRGPDPLESQSKNDDDTFHVLGVPSEGLAVDLDAAVALLDGHHAQRDPTVVGEGPTILVVIEQECTDCCASPPCSASEFRDPHLFLQRSDDGGQRWLDAPIPLLAEGEAAGDDPSACRRGGVATGGVARRGRGPPRPGPGRWWPVADGARRGRRGGGRPVGRAHPRHPLR